MAIDYTSDRGRVRLLISDINENSPVFTDPQIDAFLLLEGENVKLAAAQALDTIASDEALTLKVIKDRDLSTDGAAVAKSLREHAAALRRRAADDVARAEQDAEDDGFTFDVVDIVGGC